MQGADQKLCKTANEIVSTLCPMMSFEKKDNPEKISDNWGICLNWNVAAKYQPKFVANRKLKERLNKTM